MPKKKKLKSKTKAETATDPHAKREANKYDKPIPSREFLLSVITKYEAPISHKQLCIDLQMDKEGEIALRRRLRAMERDGQIISNRRGAYGLIDKMGLIKGHVQGHRDGYGFLIPNDGSDDLYLHHRQMRKVFDGDEVLVQVAGVDRRGRQEGHIVEVLTYNTHQLVGRFDSLETDGLVIAENARVGHSVIVPRDKFMSAKPGQLVTVKITRQPEERRQPSGEIIEVLGDHMAPGMEIDVAIRAHEIPYLWPAEVNQEIKTFGSEPSETDKKYRVDLRDKVFVTIDGEDARDFDDAVYCEKKKSGGWRLWVAIADVSHYVGVASALDHEANNRGTSVYFPDHVIPMLPEELSNGLCSLKPEVDRLCMVCEMSISAKGSLSRFQFFEGIMHSKARLTYTQVGAILEDKTAVDNKLKPIVVHLLELQQLYQTLRLARETRGAMEFDSTETRIMFDKKRKISAIVPVVRNDAHRLIEECMLCANVASARFLEKHNINGLYRVHDGPKGEKLDKLRQFLGELGLSLGGGLNPKPSDYQKLTACLDDRPDRHLIQTMMLRSMNQAVYEPDNRGHFGLAYTAYSHFTSPIRRYPDLLVHRAIRQLIRSNQESVYVQRIKGAKRLSKKAIYPYEMKDMLAFGEHCSLAERRADDATRDVVSWLKCEYLLDRVGEVFDGVVTGVTAFGLFVELADLYVEGLVHVSSLSSDYYHFDAAKQRLIGKSSRQSFRLGDVMQVQISSVDLDERKVDLSPVQSNAQKTSHKTPKAKHSKRHKANSTAKLTKGNRGPKKKKGGKKATRRAGK